MTRRPQESTPSTNEKLQTTPVAIIGIGSLFPQARTTQDYWENILRKIDCVTDVPASRWSIDDYYDPDPSAPDKTYCKRGGFLPDVEFDPMEFGLPPNILEVTDVSQLLSLVVAKETLENAGYGENTEFDRERTGCILGFVGTSSKLFTPLMTRLQYPVWEKVLRSVGIPENDTARIVEKMKLAYVRWEENSFPGAIGNVVSGRICNRFDLGGTNCVVDAACASSLAAVRMAVGELIEGRASMMLTGGIDTDNSINSYMCFSKTPAFTKKESVRPFDAESGGMMVGEGLGMLVLKRLADAERDGDRVYAVIRAIGTSSDGRFKSIYAPRPAGQAKALRRAYAEAGFPPSSVGLIEAHGTGTMAGDPAEFQGIKEVFGEGNPRRQHIALGSVKSQIAHTKAAAGAASLIKVSLALFHKILPPTINVTQPNPKIGIEDSPFYLNTEARPWIRAKNGAPRRAGVSSFGFGGTNFHVVLEEHEAEHRGAYRVNRTAQPVILSAAGPEALRAACQKALESLKGESAGQNVGEDYFLNLVEASQEAEIPQSHARVGFAAETPAEAIQALQICVDTLAEKGGQETWEHPKGIYYRRNGLETKGKVVALFSGQGSQYLEMGREAALNFPALREAFAAVDELFLADGLEPLSARVYPVPVFNAKEREQLSETLTRTEHAQPAIGTLSVGLYRLLQEAGFQADFTAGHSFGELTALWAAGVLPEEDYFTLAKARGKAMAAPDDPNFDAGTMVAVKGDIERVREVFQDDPEVTLANWNANNQVVIAGTKPAMARAQEKLAGLGYQVVSLPVSAAFHTPLVGHAQKPFAEAIARARFRKPKTRVFSNTTGKAHGDDPKAISAVLAGHILNPVRFRDEIENIYAEGGAIFVEFGPKNVLTNLVGNILSGRPHLAVALNASPKKDSDRQLREAVVILKVAGLPLKNFDPFAAAKPAVKPAKKSAVTVMLNGGYYVSEKTRSAFEESLADGYQISLLAEKPAPAPLADGGEAIHQPVEDRMSTNEQLSFRYESVIAEYQTHQSETLRLHEQYLRTEEEYARAFTQMTALQSELVGKSGSDLSAILPLFESLERSMARFHEHQAETLRVHQHYLETQSALSQNFLQASGAPAAPARPAVPAPVFSPAPAPAPLPRMVEIPQPIKSNGNGHSQHAPAPAPVSAAPVPIPAAPAPVATLVPAAPAPVTPAAAPGVDAAALKAALLEIVSEKTGYPVETLEMDMDMEADLGIDSIKRVEILGGMQERFPSLPKVDSTVLAELRTLGQIIDALHAPVGQAVSTEQQGKAADPAPAAPPVLVETAPAAQDAPVGGGVSVEMLSQSLLGIVSEKTGYPVETLELDMNLEADLGIDSIKRVEILGGLQDQYPQLPKVDPSALAELATLGQIISHMNQVSGAANAAPSVGGTAQSPFDRQDDPAVDFGIDRDLVIRKILPAPDCLEFNLPENHICLVTDNGTALTAELAQMLTGRGWPVVVLRFPAAAVPRAAHLPASLPSVELGELSEAALQSGLESIASQYGPTGVFIYLAPPTAEVAQDPVAFPESEKALLKMVFLAAKHLKPVLTAAAGQGRAAFLTVTSLDGEFGLGAEANYTPVSGGLFGLVKSLNLEWEAVFCRAVDLSPALEPHRAAGYVFAELSDPNLLISEVGYTLTERSTLALAPVAVPVTGHYNSRNGR